MSSTISYRGVVKGSDVSFKGVIGIGFWFGGRVSSKHILEALTSFWPMSFPTLGIFNYQKKTFGIFMESWFLFSIVFCLVIL